MAVGRYDRQVALPGFGEAAQRKLREATVVVVGAGGLGSPVLTYLAGCGVGHLIIVDDDVVALHNLHRQVIYTSAQIGRPKAELAAQFVTALNPEVRATPVRERVTGDTASSLVASANAVVDCCDNLPTRYAVNEACVRARVPLVWAAIGRYAGRCSVVLPGGPCLACLMGPIGDVPHLPPVEETGVFPPVCGVTGSLAAGETVKVLTGVGHPLAGRLANIDALTGELAVIDIAKNPQCPISCWS